MNYIYMSERSHKFRQYEDINKKRNTIDETNGMLEDYDRYLIEPFDIGGAVGGVASGVGSGVGGAVGGVASGMGDLASGIGSGVSSVVTAWFKGVSGLMSSLSMPLIIGIVVVIIIILGFIFWPKSEDESDSKLNKN